MAKKPEENINFHLHSNNVPVLFTDTVFMNVNEDGVTFDVCQKIPGSNSELQVVTRLGMSRQHAEKFVKKLSEILALTTNQSKTEGKN